MPLPYSRLLQVEVFDFDESTNAEGISFIIISVALHRPWIQFQTQFFSYPFIIATSEKGLSARSACRTSYLYLSLRTRPLLHRFGSQFDECRARDLYFSYLIRVETIDC